MIISEEEIRKKVAVEEVVGEDKQRSFLFLENDLAAKKYKIYKK